MQQEDWDVLKAQMSRPYGSMELQCDQYKVALQQAISSKNKSWSTVVYVDGVFKGLWLSMENGEPTHDEGRRFMHKMTRSMHGRKIIDEVRKTLGKREADKWAAEKFVHLSPCWTSFNSLKKHLLANNTSIERIH